MQYVSEQYRQEMRTPFRGASYVYAYIGLINSDAQQNATITSSFSGDESQLYDNPSSSYQGVTSNEADGSITFTFTDIYEANIAGLTLELMTLPDSVTVTNGTKTQTYSVGSSSTVIIDDGYTNCHYIKITPNTGKLKVKSILFGIGLEFTNRQIINTNRHNIVNHISNDLPQKSFTLTVDNRAHKFNKDNPYGYADYFQEKQEVRFDYGRELSDGSIYKIKGGKVLLKNWSSDDYTAKFSCVGYLDYLEGRFVKGKFYESGISAYDLAEIVFADAGVTNYSLDTALKKVAIYNPIPPCEYRDALKMIANASKCTLYEDRDGNICIKNANRPSYVGNVSFTGATDYCIPSAIFDDNSAYNYADAEQGYVFGDSSLLYLPVNENFKQVGFVSSQVANSNGLFTNNPHIDITYVSPFTISLLIMNFAVVVPTSVTLTYKLKGVTVHTHTITSSLSTATSYEYEAEIDMLTITFDSATPNQRIHLNNIYMGGKVEYELTYHELKESPVASSLERVSKINVHSYSYNYEVMDDGTGKGSKITVDTYPNVDGGETVDIKSITSIYGSAIASMAVSVGENLITFDNPYYNYKLSSGSIKESGAYYIIVESDSEQNIDIYAQAFVVTDNVQVIKVHEKGVEKTSSNPLISNSVMAKDHGEWLRDFFDDDVEYSLTYRGDPTLDADDLIYLENNFVVNNEVRIEEENINTSMGMDFTCKLQCRRTSFQTSATISKAIVGKVKVGEVLS